MNKVFLLFISFLTLLQLEVKSKDYRESIFLNNLCKHDKDMYGYLHLSCSACPELIEKLQLKKHPSKVRKNKNQLQLALKSGKKKLITNILDPQDDGKNSQIFFFRDYCPSIGYYIVQVLGYEDCELALINEVDGEIYFTANLPIISPNKQNIAVNLTDVGGMSAYTNNTITIYNLSKSSLKDVWSISKDSQEVQFYNIYWINDNTLSFNKCTFSECSVKNSLVNYINGKWQLQE